jgi:SNF2 family DNA or RNA helicase
MELKEFLGEFGESLRKKIDLCPVYDPANMDEWDKENLIKIERLIQEASRDDIPAQKNGILALAKGFYPKRKRAAILVGEMGVGKTFCAAAVPALNPRKNHRTLIMAPGHLVEKWIREIRNTLPHVTKIVNLNNPGLSELFALKGKKPKGMEFYVIGKERARNHFAWKSAVIYRGETPYCPQCGKPLDELKANFRTRKIKCPECESPLWQADREGPRRYAKAEYIKRYLAKGTFDLFVPDETHEYKGGDTAQGQALACLAASARHTLPLTGTLMGGYATNMFYLLWRMFPELIVDKAPYRAEKTFAAQYGILETTRKEPLKDNTHSLGGQRAKELVKEKPGVSPLLLTDFLLENAVFIRLSDISDKLPLFQEEVVGVQMLPDQEEAYKELENDLRKACSQAVAMGDLSLLGALVNSLLAYPDGCRKGEEVFHPHTGQFVAGAPPIEAGLLPKEERLLELVQQEVSQGRKCLICLEHTGKRDLIPTLTERLKKIGISPLILRADNPPVAKREGFIKKMAPYHDVMIANPNLIKTGLDLIEFPTLIFFQTGYSVYTLRQASRRSWRIGQTKPVKVYYLSYSDTMQEKALALIASKMETALAVEGELSDKGLAAMAESGSSMIIELARSLIDKQEMPSLEEAWLGYQQQEVQAYSIMSAVKPEKPVEDITQTTTITAITPKEEQTTVAVTRVIRGKAYPKRKTADSSRVRNLVLFQSNTPDLNEDYEFVGYVGSHHFVFRGGQVFYNDKIVGEYDPSYQGTINNKPIELVKSGKVYLMVELQEKAA